MNQFEAQVSSSRPERRRYYLSGALVIFSLVLLFAPLWIGWIEASRDLRLINDDALQQIVPLYRCSDNQLFPGDEIVDYYARAILPVGYRAIYCLPALSGVDPEIASRVLPTLLVLATVSLLAAAARLIGGWPAAWATAALVLGSSLPMSRMAGGLPRGFGFPVIALTIFLLAAGKVRWLGVVIVVSASVYPSAAFVVGGALTLALFLPGDSISGDAREWSLRRRIALTIVVGVTSLALIAPTAILGSQWGARVDPTATIDFPEVGPGGRYGDGDRFVSSELIPDSLEQARRSVAEGVVPWIDTPDMLTSVFLLASLVGWIFLMRRSEASRRVTLVVMSSGVCYLLSVLLEPWLYLPQRFIEYPVPSMTWLILGAAMPSLVQVVASTRRWSRPTAAVMAVSIVLLCGGIGDPRSGLNTVAPRGGVAEVARMLPIDTLVAGWPNGEVNVIPYLSRRSAFVTFETHQAFHEQYVLEMRQRTNALIAAFFGADAAPLLKLRDEYGVDILLVEWDRVYEHGTYFEPFTSRISDARAALGARAPYVRLIGDEAVIYRDKELTAIDLRRLAPDTSYVSQRSTP